MLTEEQVNKIIKNELSYRTSRSGGKGGQNVNKVESKVEITFNVALSESLNDRQKLIILNTYPALVDGTGIQLESSQHRSQLENKEDVRNKLIQLLNRLLKPVKKRVPTKPGKAAKQRKLLNKKHQSEKKVLRQKPR